ncbi:MAG: YodC family protein [Pseudomonadota bacterium]
MSIQAGDVVRLKSGGPKMTVTALGDRLGTLSVWCSWFVGSKKDSEVFPVEAVELAKLDSDPVPSLRPESSLVAARRGRLR